jgi:hypothetical protein
MGVPGLYRHELENLGRRITQVQQRIDDLKWRVASAEQGGGDSSSIRDLLPQSQETLAHMLARRDAILREIVAQPA